MKTLIMMLLFLPLMGCESLKGDKGDKGDMGDPAQITIYNGFVTSDAQVISVPEYHGTAEISVSVGDGAEFVEAPFFSPGVGVNCYYGAETYVVTIYNAQMVAATHYKIVVVREVSSSGLSRLRP